MFDHVNAFYERLLQSFQTTSAPFYTYYDQQFSYAECYQYLKKLNTVLHEYQHQRIAVYAAKNIENYCSIFSILLSANVWVPLSPLQPHKRSLEILKIAEVQLVLTDEPLPPEIEQYLEAQNIRTLQISQILQQEDTREIELKPFQPDELAYIMFTSGSTGTPKGVPMTHENYINFIQNALEILPFEQGEVFSDYHDFGFDISIFYLFCAVLTQSAFAPVLKPEELFFPLPHIIDHRITVWSSVPSALRSLQTLRPNDQIETSLKIMFLCGEPFRLDVLKYCYHNLNVPHVYNFYGLTETGVENFFHSCQPGDLQRFEAQGFVPIGKPLKGNQVRVGENDELWLSGCQVTPGYLGGIGQDRFEVIDGERWFRSGDVVQQFEEVYFCKGRLDAQVKLNGYRVELMDIEAHVRRFPGVEDSVCFVHQVGEQSTLICALHTSSELALPDLKAALKTELPPYMIPKQFFMMESFPCNQNGKIDRKAIAAHYCL